VTFAVEEGPRYRIGKLTIAERDHAGRLVPTLGGRDLRSLLSAKDGDWFSRAVLIHDLGAISTLYRDAGYAAVEVFPEPRQDRARAVVDVDVPVHRGPLVRVDTIAVLGNARVTTEAIRRVIGMTEGQIFNETQLLEAKRHLQGLGAFRRVDVSTEKGSDAEHWKVNFEVEEKER
jgi:outer membrane protein insertion porin family